MTTWNPKANAIFAEAAEISDTIDREVFLRERCGADSNLRRDVESLLADAERGDEFLNEPAVSLGRSEDADDVAVGSTFNGYKLLQRIGEGGFGVVYMAQQTEPVRRKLALKVIKPGMDSRDVIARFEAERQALALMEHPNIAKVIDAGATPFGRPYFAMELVEGVPITEYCDANQLDTRARLRLFRSVCAAVQHAHQKGVIHRDLKPSNVMVTMLDGKPLVKVIDFGVAKAINRELTDKTLFTAYGQMIGTPQYMSPEQAVMSAVDVDTRSDVYSLGILLYELLTGSTPVDGARLRASGYAEMQRIIREEDPPKPSTRLSTLGDRLTTVARNRESEPSRLQRQLRGEVDWVVMRALEKDRRRRYQSVEALAIEIHRHLNNEPVEACPPSLRYQLHKLTSRHKRAITTAAVVVATLVLGLVGTSWMAMRAHHQENLALAARIKSQTEANRALQLMKRVREELREKVMFYAMNGERMRTEKAIDAVLSLGDDEVWAERMRGFAAHFSGDEVAAKKHYNRAIELGDNSIAIHSLWHDVGYATNDRVRADKHGHLARTLPRRTVEDELFYCNASYQINPQEAFETVDRIFGDRRSPFALFVRARCRTSLAYESGRLDVVEEMLDDMIGAAALMPDSRVVGTLVSSYAAAVNIARHVDNQSAMDYYIRRGTQVAEALAAHSGREWAPISYFYLSVGEFEKAKKTLKEAALHSDAGKYFYAEFLLAEGNASAALDELDKIDPSKMNAIDAYALAYAESPKTRSKARDMLLDQLRVNGQEKLWAIDLLNQIGFADVASEEARRIAGELRNNNESVSPWFLYFAEEDGFDEQTMLEQAKRSRHATVKAHWRIALKKLSTHNRAEAKNHLRLQIQASTTSAIGAKTLLRRLEEENWPHWMAESEPTQHTGKH